MKKLIIAALLSILSTVSFADQNFTIFPYAATGGTATRTTPNRIIDTGANVKEFGAICDGSTHPLSGTYASLAAARAVYPFVDDLTQEIDWAAVQQAIDTLDPNNNGDGKRTVWLPDGANCQMSLPIYLDSPGNLRGGGTNYNSVFTYSLLGTAKSGGITYISIQNSNLNNTPASSPTFWRPLRWDSGVTYVTNDIVVYNGIPWESVQAGNTNHIPTLANLTWWKSASNKLTPYRNYPYTLTAPDNYPAPFVNGSRLYTSFNNAPALIVGPGNGNVVRNITVQNVGFGGAAGWRCGLPPTGLGILISGGSFGASRTLIENVGVYAYYVGIATGGEQAALADSNTIRGSLIEWACAAIDFQQSQNFINLIEATNATSSTTAIKNVVGTPITVVGGNMSAVTSKSNAFTIGSVSALTKLGAGLGYQFTATITGATDYLTSGVLDGITIPTAHFGTIPMTMTAYNSGTGVGTFVTTPSWSNFSFPNIDATATTALQTDIQAATKIYAAELTRVFWGSGINATGIHLEQTSGATTSLIRAGQGFGGITYSTISNVAGANTDPAMPNFGPNAIPTPTDAQQAIYYAMQVFGYIVIESSNVEIRNSALGMLTDPTLIDYASDGSSAFRLVIDKTTTVRFNVRNGTNGGGFLYANSYYSTNSPNLGSGEYDISPFMYRLNQLSYSNASGLPLFSWGRAPQWGFRPAAFTSPIITPAGATALAGALPAITNTGSGTNIQYSVGYPLIWGGQQYKIYDWYTGSLAHYGLISSHHFYTYGQDLTTTNVPNLSLSYKGQSFAVYANIELFNLIFPGLGVKLNDGVSDVLYIVTGTYPGMLYFTVSAAATSQGGPLSGLKTTVFTPAAFKQEALSLTNLNFLMKRDLDPAANDNSPAFLDSAA